MNVSYSSLILLIMLVPSDVGSKFILLMGKESQRLNSLPRIHSGITHAAGAFLKLAGRKVDWGLGCHPGQAGCQAGVSSGPGGGAGT